MGMNSYRNYPKSPLAGGTFLYKDRPSEPEVLGPKSRRARHNYKPAPSASRYLAMLESGVRFEQMLKIIIKWSPDEIIEISGTAIVSERLICFEDRVSAATIWALEGLGNHVSRYTSA